MLATIGRRSGILVAKTFTASTSRPAGCGNHAAADPFCGWHRFAKLPARSPGRDATRPGNRAQHSPGARCRDAADDRRAAGAGADQRVARSRLRGLPPDCARVFGAVRRRRRYPGCGPRRPTGVLLAHARCRKPAVTQQPRHCEEGVRGKEAGLFQPVLRGRQATADRNGRSARHSRRRGRSTTSPSARRSRFSRPWSSSSVRARTGPSRSSTAKAPISPGCPIRRIRSDKRPRLPSMRRCSAPPKRPSRRCRSKACR